jgi:hypothetical protein
MRPAIADLDRAINGAVAAALRGEASLYHLISHVCFGRDPDPEGPQWPAEAEAVWRIAVDRWSAARRQGEQEGRTRSRARRAKGLGARRYRRYSAPEPAQVWDAIETLSASCHPWWQAPISLATLAARLGLGDRAAAYHIVQVQRWHFAGRGRARHIDRVVCVQCHAPVPPQEVVARRCARCTRLSV